MDERLTQDLQPRLNALVEIAELLNSKSHGDANVQRLLSVARDLLDNVQQQDVRESSSDATPPPPTEAQCDVLYVEDNPRSFAAVKLLLGGKRALKIVQAALGETGIAFAQMNHPKLILLDLNLPDIHGSEVISRLQKDPVTAAIPVIVLSADATPSQIERLLVLGAKNYLTKPFDTKAFLAVVDEALGEDARAPIS